MTLSKEVANFNTSAITFILLTTLVISAQVNAAGYMLVFVFYILTKLHVGNLLMRKSEATLFLIISFLGLCSLLSKEINFTNTVESLFKLVSFICVMWLSSTISLEIKRRVIELLSILIIFTIPLYALHEERFSSIFTHANHLAYVCCILIYFYLFIDENKLVNKTKMLCVFLLFSIVLSKSSGGLIVCASLLFIKFLSVRGSLKYILASVFLIAIAGLYYLGFFDSITDKLAHSFSLNDLLTKADNRAFGSDGSFVWRITYWIAIVTDTIREGSQYVFFGLGLGSMEAGSYYFDYMITDPHNDYVRVFAETGVVGFILTFIFLKKSLYVMFDYRAFIFLGLPMLVGNILVNVTFMFLLYLMNDRRFCENEKGSNCNSIKR